MRREGVATENTRYVWALYPTNAHVVSFFRLPVLSFSRLPQHTWVWVEIKPPRIGPQVLVLSIYQAQPKIAPSFGASPRGGHSNSPFFPTIVLFEHRIHCPWVSGNF